MRIALYPGSFDPPTFGHIDIIKRSFVLCDKLFIGIGVHATKTPLFTFDERAAMLKDYVSAMARDHGVDLEIIEFQGLLVDVAKQIDAKIIIRGLRTGSDYDYESQMVDMNRVLYPYAETIFLSAMPELGAISSTLVRQIAQFGGDVSAFTPPDIVARLQEKFRR